MFPLVDIGNRYAHLYLDGEIRNLSYEALFEEFKNRKVYYICVNQALKKRLQEFTTWIDLEPFVKLLGAYDGMGIDRQMLLLSRGDGIYIDAGSAITIDKKEDTVFRGGAILPGIWSLKNAYASISPALKLESLEEVDIASLPKANTKETLSFSIIAPIVAFVEKINSAKLPIYCCGGDGELLARYIDGAHYDSILVFEGMKKVIKDCKC